MEVDVRDLRLNLRDPMVQESVPQAFLDKEEDKKEKEKEKRAEIKAAEAGPTVPDVAPPG